MAEFGYAVQPRSTRLIAAEAEAFLGRCAPQHLEQPGPLDVVSLVDHGLESQGISVYPVTPKELPDSEAETRAGVGNWLEIWMRDEFFDSLFEWNHRSVRARSTLAHEIGHCVLHASEVRAGRHHPEVLALRRAPRGSLKAYEDCEWQAHAFAGAFLMPLATVRSVDLEDVLAVAETFGVSDRFVLSYRKRMKRLI